MTNGNLSEGVEFAFAVAHTADGWISTLRSAVKGVGYEVAMHKPAPNVKSIYELTLHTVQYAESLLADLSGAPGASFQDWPKVDAPTKADWAKLKARVNATISGLEECIGRLSDEQLMAPPDGMKTPRYKRILNITIHDAYHAGQIIKLKQIYKGSHAPGPS